MILHLSQYTCGFLSGESVLSKSGIVVNIDRCYHRQVSPASMELQSIGNSSVSGEMKVSRRASIQATQPRQCQTFSHTKIPISNVRKKDINSTKSIQFCPFLESGRCIKKLELAED